MAAVWGEVHLLNLHLEFNLEYFLPLELNGPDFENLIR